MMFSAKSLLPVFGILSVVLLGGFGFYFNTRSGNVSVRRINLKVAHPEGFNHFLEYEGMMYIPFTEKTKNNSNSAWSNTSITLTVLLLTFGAWAYKKFCDLSTSRDGALKEKVMKDRQNTNLQNELKILKQRNINLIDINLKIKEEKKKLEENYEKEIKHLAQCESRLTTMEHNLNRRSLEIQEQYDIAKNLQHEIERLEEVIVAKNFKDEENCNLLNERDKEIMKLRLHIVDMKASMDDLTIKCDAIECDKKEKMNEIERRDQQILQLRGELESLQSRLQTEEHERRLAQHEKDMNDIYENLKILDIKNESLANRYLEMEHKVKDLDARTIPVQEELKKTQVELHRQEKENQELKNALNKQAHRNEENIKEIGNIRKLCEEEIRLTEEITQQDNISSDEEIMAEEPKPLTKEEADYYCAEPDESTKEFIFQQTMIRVKDPRPSLDFYTRVLGMRLLKKIDFSSLKFSIYFVGYESAEDIPTDEDERTTWCFSQKGTLELTHIWGTESDPDFAGYHNGNRDPKGFGHIGITVPDVEKACDRFETLDMKFVKKPNYGKIKNIAFIQDPDGYWVEILNAAKMPETIKPFEYIEG